METTYCLLEAILLKADEGAHALTLASSINRFLNLITHAGMNMFNLSKYYDVAKVMGLPRWIVDVRHDTNHGQMPSYYVLKSAVSYCFKWLVINYWEHEDALREKEDNVLADIRNHENYENIHQLLDCYKYLRIYSLWGNKNLEEIRDQQEIYKFLEAFISDMQSAPPKKKKVKLSPSSKADRKITIYESAVYVRNRIHKLITVKNDSDVKALIQTLTHDQLMLPQDELVQSLKENTDKEILPENLVKVWKDVLSMMHQAGLLPKLATSLVKVISSTSSNSFENQLALKWLEKILDALHGSKKKNWLNFQLSDDEFSDRKWNDFVEAYVLSNHSSLLANLDRISGFRMPPFSKDQCNMIKRLSSICHGIEIEPSESSDWTVKTVDDIHDGSVHNPAKNWRLSSNVDWSELPLGHFVSAKECQEEEKNGEDFVSVDLTLVEDVTIVDWKNVMPHVSSE